MEGSVDLHIHSTASDGDLTPSEVVREAKRMGLRAIALTDHDTIDGCEEFFDEARKQDMEVLGGVEIGVANDLQRGLKEVHVLAYFREGQDLYPLSKALEKLQESKCNWSEKQVALLEDKGFNVPYEEVLKVASDSPTVRRPHIWKVLDRYNEGSLKAQQYFEKTDFGGPWFVQKEFEMTIEETMEMISSSAAISVLAHPALYGVWPDGALNVVKIAREAGVQGVEAIYSYDFIGEGREFPSSKTVAERIKRELLHEKLLLTGGSDFHGSANKKLALGCAKVPYQCFEALRAALSSS